MKKVGLNDRARSISFSFLTAIPAAAIFICTLIPYLPVGQADQETPALAGHARHYAQSQYLFAGEPIPGRFPGQAARGAAVLRLPAGDAFYLFSNAMIGIMRSFNKSLIYNKKRNAFETRWMAIKLTLLVFFIVIGSVLLLVTQAELLRSLLKWMHITKHSARIRWLFKT